MLTLLLRNSAAAGGTKGYRSLFAFWMGGGSIVPEPPAFNPAWARSATTVAIHPLWGVR